MGEKNVLWISAVKFRINLRYREDFFEKWKNEDEVLEEDPAVIGRRRGDLEKDNQSAFNRK